MIKTRGKFIMSVAYVSPPALFRIVQKNPLHRFHRPPGPNTKQSSDGQRVACGSMDGNVYIFDLGTGNLVKKIENGLILYT